MERLTATVLAVTLLSASPGWACLAGTKCMTVPETKKISSPYDVGEVLPRGRYNVLLNTRYHGLPASDGSFWYYKVDRHVLKVDARSHVVLEDVTTKARRVLR